MHSARVVPAATGTKTFSPAAFTVTKEVSSADSLGTFITYERMDVKPLAFK